MATRPEASKGSPGARLSAYFCALLARFGPQRWWPARTRFEVILGSILTQNTSWNNTSLGESSLRSWSLLSHARFQGAALEEIERAFRPPGFFRQKARAIRGFVDWVRQNHGGSPSHAPALPAPELRKELLALREIGPETADAIMIYNANRPSFVGDAYTRRILGRHGWLPEDVSYDQAQDVPHRRLPPDAVLFNEFHALLVEAATRRCRRAAPLCAGCPLEFDLLRESEGRLIPLRQRLPAGGVVRRSAVV
jgi:endonuclease III related protein